MLLQNIEIQATELLTTGTSYDLVCFLKIFLNIPIPASFCLFSSFSHYNFNNTIWKKCRWCAWDLNPGPQDARRRWNQRAIVTTKSANTLSPLARSYKHSFYVSIVTCSFTYFSQFRMSFCTEKYLFRIGSLLVQRLVKNNYHTTCVWHRHNETLFFVKIGSIKFACL